MKRTRGRTSLDDSWWLFLLNFLARPEQVTYQRQMERRHGTSFNIQNMFVLCSEQ